MLRIRGFGERLDERRREVGNIFARRRTERIVGTAREREHVPREIGRWRSYPRFERDLHRWLVGRFERDEELVERRRGRRARRKRCESFRDAPSMFFEIFFELRSG